MVDPWVLSTDVVSIIGVWLLTPVLWIALFLWAWTRPVQAAASGFGRMTFWLLLPGAFLASFADAPFFPWAGNVLAINLGGALIPILLSVVILRREFATSNWAPLGGVFLFVAVETAVQFAIVLLTPPRWADLLVAAAAGGTAVFAFLLFPLWAPRPVSIRAVTLLSLTSAAVTITFLTSSAVPGEGIVSTFPLYLIGPVLVGSVAVGLADRLWGASPFQGLGVGFASATLGTLIGADVLHEPPLYGGGGGALLAIGGAGVQDLVYFSGLLAVGAGLLFIALGYRKSITIPVDATPPAPSPDEALRMAGIRLAARDTTGAVRDGLRASLGAAGRARSNWQLPPPTELAAAWDGLPVAPYVLNDYRNLVAAAQQPVVTPPEAYRSVAMAAQFVRLGRDLSRLRFAALGRRAWATIVDLSVVTAPAVVLWTVLSVTQKGSLSTVGLGLAFNLSVFGYIAYALLYFVVFDALWGATPGKMLLRLRVTDRSLARPTPLQSLLRESPKAVPITVIGELGGPAILYLARASSSTVTSLGINVALFTGTFLLGIVVLVVTMALAVGAIQVARDSERQRLGDRWASTWVVDRRAFTPAWGATREPASGSSESARSG